MQGAVPGPFVSTSLSVSDVSLYTLPPTETTGWFFYVSIYTSFIDHYLVAIGGHWILTCDSICHL